MKAQRERTREKERERGGREGEGKAGKREMVVARGMRQKKEDTQLGEREERKGRWV